MRKLNFFVKTYKMAFFLAAKLFVDAFALLPPSAFNSSFYDDSTTWTINAPEILDFKFTPNPAIEGGNVNVTCIVRPRDAQVLIIRINKDENFEQSADFTEEVENTTISIYSAEEN